MVKVSIKSDEIAQFLEFFLMADSKPVGSFLKSLNQKEAWLNWVSEADVKLKKKYEKIWDKLQPNPDIGQLFQLDHLDGFEDWINQRVPKSNTGISNAPAPYSYLSNWFGVRAEIVNIDTIQPFDLSVPTYLVKSRMGTSKTQAILKTVKQNSVLISTYITCRCTLGEEFSKECKKKGIEVLHYQQMDGFNRDQLLKRIDQMRRGQIEAKPMIYVVQMESLGKFFNVYRPPFPDLLLLDESTSLLKQLDSPTNKKAFHANKRTFEDLIKETQNVIALCADMDERTTGLIKELRPIDSIRAIVNHKQVEDFKAVCLPNRQYLMTQMCQDLNNDKKIFCVCVNKSEQQRLHLAVSRMCPTVKHKICNSETNKDAKQIADAFEEIKKSEAGGAETGDLNDPTIAEGVNAEWVKFDLVSITQTFTVGVSFNLEHFDRVYVFGDCRIGCARDWLQMTGRVRNVKDRVIYYNIKTQHGKLKTRLEDIERDIRLRFQTAQQLRNKLSEKTQTVNPGHYDDKLEKMIAESDRQLKNVNGVAEYVQRKGWMFRIHCLNVQETNLTWNGGNVEFERLLKSKGYQVETQELDEDQEAEAERFAQTLDECKQQVKEIKQSDYDNLPLFESEEEFEKMIKRRNARKTTHLDELRIEKHYCHSFFAEDYRLDYQTFLYVQRNLPRLRYWYLERHIPHKLIMLKEMEDIAENPFLQKFHTVQRLAVINLVNFFRVDRELVKQKYEISPDADTVGFLTTEPFKTRPNEANSLLINTANACNVNVNARLLRLTFKEPANDEEKTEITKTKKNQATHQIQVLKDILKTSDDYDLYSTRKQVSLRINGKRENFTIYKINQSEAMKLMAQHFNGQRDVEAVQRWFDRHVVSEDEQAEIDKQTK